MSTSTDKNMLHTLDEHRKAMHMLLSQMDNEERIQYIKIMLPELLNFGNQSLNGQQKLNFKRTLPVQNLSKAELEMINELAAKTEKLYNTINNDYFG
jgi:hypothetical protein